MYSGQGHLSLQSMPFFFFYIKSSQIKGQNLTFCLNGFVHSFINRCV